MADNEERPKLTERVSRLSLLFVTMLGAQFIASFLPLPLTYLAAPFVLGAVVVGIMLMVALSRVDSMLMWVLTIVGTLMSVGMGLTLATTSALHGPAFAAQQCLDRALTESATDACWEQYELDVYAETEGWPPSIREGIAQQLGLDPEELAEPSPSPSE